MDNAGKLQHIAKDLVEELHDDICGRSGMDFRSFDDDVIQEIEETHYQITLKYLRKLDIN